ncbi:hypothetical protein TSUD_294430 [Trifolium subterraneum]|uniref:RNase H type-1 domain-containing protein n=1 Tax=Trifolium subterraneum TaxID=3900 RepID=A0A2Z6MSA8_TRISU|nr:hypothetical protein TSUD_294430 [Trifolium subterraneum]
MIGGGTLNGDSKAPVTKEVIWHPPIPNWIKCNIDGASKGNPGISSCGGIFRNNAADFMLCFAKPLGFTTSYQDELCGVIRAIEIAHQMNWHNLWLETDFALVVLAVNNPSSHVTWRAEISMKKEAPVNFLIDPQEGRWTLRPADVLVYGWVGLTALKAASSKMRKHEKACSDNQHVFVPFAFDTFGFLAPEAVNLLKRVQKVMHSNVVSPRFMNVVF